MLSFKRFNFGDVRVDTHSVEHLAKYINNLKKWRGVNQDVKDSEGNGLPISLIYKNEQINEKILLAMNKAARKVIQDHIPEIEQQLVKLTVKGTD